MSYEKKIYVRSYELPLNWLEEFPQIWFEGQFYLYKTNLKVLVQRVPKNYSNA